MLSVMSGMLEVLSLERQEPACLDKFDQDDVSYKRFAVKQYYSLNGTVVVL